MVDAHSGVLLVDLLGVVGSIILNLQVLGVLVYPFRLVLSPWNLLRILWSGRVMCTSLGVT